jgi:hypothetical protein
LQRTGKRREVLVSKQRIYNNLILSTRIPINVVVSFASWSSLQFGSPDCYYHTDYIDRMIIQTLAPICVSAILFFILAVHLFFMRNADVGDREIVGSRYFTLFLLLTYLVLPGVAISIFGAFGCVNVDPDHVLSTDSTFMLRELGVSCSSARYRFGVNWAIAMIFVYPFGILCLYTYVLYINRKAIKRWEGSPEAVEDGLGFLRAKSSNLSRRAIDNSDKMILSNLITPREIKLLFRSYKEKYWYWEVIETMRRILLTGVVSIVARGESSIADHVIFLKPLCIHSSFNASCFVCQARASRSCSLSSFRSSI